MTEATPDRGEGVVRWSYESPIGVNSGADGILQALGSLETPGSRPEGPE